MEASQREDVALGSVKTVRLRGPYAEGLEPALEFCARDLLREGWCGGGRKHNVSRR